MEERTKVYEVGSFTFTATCHDPYGFWTIIENKPGVNPKEFKGQFSSIYEVQRAINQYVNRKKAEQAKPTQEQKRQARTFPKREEATQELFAGE